MSTLLSHVIKWIKQIALPNVGGPHPISWRPEWNRNVESFLNKGNLLLPDCLWAGIFFFFICLQSLAETLMLLSLRSADYRSGKYHQISWVPSLQILGPVSLQHHMNQFLNIYVCHCLFLIDNSDWYTYNFSRYFHSSISYLISFWNFYHSSCISQSSL